MRARNVTAGVLALIAAALFVRLGVWQMHRLAERRAKNALLAERLNAAPAPLSSVSLDTASARFRRVTVSGNLDYEHELALVGRALNGSPGVYLVTPLRVDGADSNPAVLVNRGWVYSPDARVVDLSRWHEPSRVIVAGYLEEFAADRRAPSREAMVARSIRAMNPAVIAELVPYPVLPLYIVAQQVEAAVLEQPTAARADHPVRLSLPEMDEGPHKSYAIQWFSFAVIALVGVSTLIWHDLHKGRATAGTGSATGSPTG